MELARHLYMVPDVTKFREDVDEPIRLSDGRSTLWPREERPRTEGAYILTIDWVTWVGLDPEDGNRRIHVRDLADLNAPAFIASTTSVENSEPWIVDNLIVWRGLDPTTGAFNVYLADLLKPDRPPVTINTADPVANEWPFLARQTSTVRSQR